MISHLNQYIIVMYCQYIMHGEAYVFFGIKVISRLIDLTFEHIAKMANKIFNILKHLKVVLYKNSSDMIKNVL